MRRQQGFTLVELLTVIAILAILYAIFTPVFIAVKGAAYAYQTQSNLSQLAKAAGMYATDHDDTMMPCSYMTPEGMQTWFGLKRNVDGKIDTTASFIRSYTRNVTLKDNTFVCKPWLGDGSGFGYNWGYIGSDFNVTNDFRAFPNAVYPAVVSELDRPSSTIGFSTSSFYYPKWQGGDGGTYDFGFISSPKFWAGNPDMDFRHMGVKKVDPVAKTITSSGNAVVLFIDGHAKSMKQESIRDDMFVRTHPDPVN